MAFIHQFADPESWIRLSMKDYVLGRMSYCLDPNEYDDIDYVFFEVRYNCARNIMSKEDILDNMYSLLDSYGWLKCYEKPKLDKVILLMLEYLELTGEFRWDFSFN